MKKKQDLKKKRRKNFGFSQLEERVVLDGTGVDVVKGVIDALTQSVQGGDEVLKTTDSNNNISITKGMLDQFKGDYEELFKSTGVVDGKSFEAVTKVYGNSVSFKDIVDALNKKYTDEKDSWATDGAQGLKGAAEQVADGKWLWAGQGRNAGVIDLKGNSKIEKLNDLKNKLKIGGGLFVTNNLDASCKEKEWNDSVGEIETLYNNGNIADINAKLADLESCLKGGFKEGIQKFKRDGGYNIEKILEGAKDREQWQGDGYAYKEGEITSEVSSQDALLIYKDQLKTDWAAGEDLIDQKYFERDLSWKAAKGILGDTNDDSKVAVVSNFGKWSEGERKNCVDSVVIRENIDKELFIKSNPKMDDNLGGSIKDLFQKELENDTNKGNFEKAWNAKKDDIKASFEDLLAKNIKGDVYKGAVDALRDAMKPVPAPAIPVPVPVPVVEKVVEPEPQPEKKALIEENLDFSFGERAGDKGLADGGEKSSFDMQEKAVSEKAAEKDGAGQEVKSGGKIGLGDVDEKQSGEASKSKGIKPDGQDALTKIINKEVGGSSPKLRDIFGKK